MKGGRWVTLLLLAASINTAKSEDPHIVGYVSDTTTLPCEHTVPKSDLEAVVWRKDTETIVAEYDIGDDPPGSFYDSMAGRASAKVFPPTLKFSSGSLEDAGVYQCEVFPLKGNAIIHRYTVTVNGSAPDPPYSKAVPPDPPYLRYRQCPLIHPTLRYRQCPPDPPYSKAVPPYPPYSKAVPPDPPYSKAVPSLFTLLYGIGSAPLISTLLYAKPFNEAIRLSGQSYQDCEEVYLPESTDALLSLTCTASSKPSSRLSWAANPATPALVVNQSTVAECNTSANGIVTCERNATIVTKDLKEVVQVTCVTHYDDRRTVITSKRACVILVPHGYHHLWVTVVVVLVVLWLIGVVVVLVIIFLIWRLAKKENKAAPVDLRLLALGLGLVILLPVLGVAVFIFLTFYWKLLPVPGQKAETKRSEVELEEQEGLSEAGSKREEGTNEEGEQGDKEEETAAKAITTGKSSQSTVDGPM
ncbi:hypothetical protein NP493_758g01021 [Ridgeia piscesae]|uniref:Ig-like domain-containing protein n=1 Tax=Ridgeia piscesae TaxID=27915 RepID=A0AAD9NLU7_RIDPI|nr:hypothetical protein NP493_758g01021 [Ridgeia piscesae]